MDDILEFLFDIIAEVLVCSDDSEKLPKTLRRVLGVVFILALAGFTLFIFHQGIVSGKTGWFVLAFILFAYMAIAFFWYLRKKK